MMRVALIRHLRPLIAPGICYGRLDLAAPEPGAGALAAMRRSLAALREAEVRTSPARRCRALATPLAKALGTTPVLDERLLELDFGAWEGLAWDSVPRAALDRWAADPWGFAPPEGEKMAALVARVTAVVRDLRAAGRDAAVVSHGGPLRLMRDLLRGRRPDLLAPSPGFGSLELVACARSAGEGGGDGEDGAPG